METGSSLNNYKIGIYVRESRDDNEENLETIETQRDLLQDYIVKNNLGVLYKVFLDDNVSGSGFERKGIQQLKADVTAGKINLVLVKDLSRLGRNNARTLLFLDFLEEYNVRVITFDGRYDSLRDNDTVGIDTWYNERYVRDISRKIRANLHYKIEKGEYIGHAPYGYKKSIERRNSLCIDTETAVVVREIFRLYRAGFGYSCIAKQLDEKGYASPSAKIRTTSPSAKWNAVAVQRILGNKVYTGDTIQGTSEKISFKSKKTRRLPSDRWVVTRNTHEAIISSVEYDEAQGIRNGRNQDAGPHKGKLHMLRGLLYCGKCGERMFARKRNSRPMGYVCSRYGKLGKAGCTSHHIGEKQIEGVLLEELCKLLLCSRVRERVKVRIEKELLGKKDRREEMLHLEQQLSARRKQQETLYMDKLEGRISDELFERVNINLESKMQQQKKELSYIKESMGEKIADGELLLKRMLEDLKSFGLTNELARLMVDKIEIFEPGDVIEGLALDEYEQEGVKAEGAAVFRFKFDTV